MENMTFKLPESYRAYCEDAAVRTEVDNLVLRARSLPADIEWRDLLAFHREALSKHREALSKHKAHKVQCEYAIFQIEFWDAVWMPALEKFDLETTLKALTIAESVDACAQRIDAKTIWDKSWFNRGFKFTTTGFSFYPCVMTEVDHVMLSIGYYDAADVQRTTELELGDKWPKDAIEDGFAFTSEELAPIQDGGIDLAPLRMAAGDALAAIKAHESDR